MCVGIPVRYGGTVLESVRFYSNTFMVHTGTGAAGTIGAADNNNGADSFDSDADEGMSSAAVGGGTEKEREVGASVFLSDRDRVLARREMRKRAEAAAREDELLTARQRYFQERVIADHAQRSQYLGSLAPFPTTAMRA